MMTPEEKSLRTRTKPSLFFQALYRNQKASSKRRGHLPPSYLFEELLDWLKIQPNINKIWSDYQASGHDRMLCPSVDRIDDTQPYSLTNIQLMTWQENLDKSRQDIRLGKLNHGKTASISVELMSPDGTKVLKRFGSYSEAAKATGTWAPGIRKVCLGLHRHAGNLNWRHA